ncbi:MULTISPECIES: hypothetical protein [Rhodanobacter]|uniref:hypothetical protein n=2 Tax=Rhodanobacteraceae TaxID=1775411 RepID=UPI000B1B3C73|nr:MULTISPECIES: hypothetical protein [Rhodanobacter]UJJ52748.1 hypothetical protein LRK52_08755 [Rhodanobacter denitrificans]UJJ53482.1 hypothetical protein LRK53_10815 [Rhodanobacter thiooxydans]UJM95519.1 hypothetical protein LRK32_08880 [Rhodanobacter denitrificans]UJM99050.1 hypothetical protein LRK44_08885 [Rhodanobacter denitrificans]UJN21535.1 hypothetical protein LRK54_17755 [Rhodanobacter denitrificans]
MMAIEALGRRGDPAAALPLARCALAHPVDVTQGLAIVRAVAKLRRDESWNDAVRLLHDHPVRAVARTARELHTPKHAATTLVPGSPDREAEVQASIDDLANRVDATERIMALGEHAIAPLRRYLREGAQVIPHGRLFAISMLARLRSPMAREGLRDVLHDIPWRRLPSSRREAEYQVKDVAIRHLITRDYPERCVDAIYAANVERLPSAVAAAGRLGLSSLAPVLVDMLRDDVLERAAADSLESLEEYGRAALLQALPALFEEAGSRVHSRLAAIRALLVLRRMHARLPPWVLRRALADGHPAIRAAAALFDDTQDNIRRAELIRGALSDCVALAVLCRERLAHRDSGFADAAREALHRNAEPDIYGNLHPLPRDAIRWLTMAEVGAGSV